MQPTILFDVDHSLLDTSRLKELLRTRLAEILGVDTKQVGRVTDTYTKILPKSTDFNPDDYIKYLMKKFEIKNSAEFKKIFFKMPDLYRAVLYPETRRVLNSLKRRYRLGIFTEGFRKFQLTKLKLSGILPIFDRDLIFIHRRKLTSRAISRLPKGSVIVDDNPEVIEALSKFPHVTPIWLNRKDKKKRSAVRTIHSLAELNQSFAS